jgi:Tat protein secretion system quality control protein TatD with DNase activity
MILEDKKISEEEMINSIKENNIEYSVQVSIETKGFSWSRDFAKRNHKAGVYYTLGIHPSSNADDASLEKLSAFTEKEMNSDYSSLLLGIGEWDLISTACASLRRCSADHLNTRSISQKNTVSRS